jgi:cobalt-zinc-cadmium resistance protein CzcA
VLCSFPEVPQCTSQVGRPDDGTDTTGFFNTEYFVDLKPKEKWRPIFHQNKDELIAAMQRELDKIPGVVWGFSQPVEDNMEEAVSGVKGELATLPTLYVWLAGERDVLPPAEPGFAEGEHVD